MDKYKVSVIIPVYNQEKLVIKAIESVPTRDDIEILVIDDASTDNTYKNVQDYANKHLDKNIIILSNSENKGVAYTVNKGYDNASGEYLVLLGSDDNFYTDKFIEIMQQLDGTDLIYFNLQINNGDVWQLTNDNKGFCCGSVKFMRKEFVGDTRNPLNAPAGEDYYFYCELLSKSPSEKFTDITVKHYNYPRENSLSNLRSKGVI